MGKRGGWAGTHAAPNALYGWPVMAALAAALLTACSAGTTSTNPSPSTAPATPSLAASSPSSSASTAPAPSPQPPVAYCPSSAMVPPGARLLPGPPAGGGAAMAYYPPTQRVVLFGGIADAVAGGRTAFGETWTWGGNSWTQLHPATSPSPRFAPAMAYDAAHGQLLLFGGICGSGPTPVGPALGDTWSWDGTNWKQLHPANSPSPRPQALMAYSPVLHGVVLFGGGGDLNNLYSDTWGWDGSTWTAIGTAPRDLQPGTAMVTSTSDVVMYGSCSSSSSAFPPTFLFDGIDWRSYQSLGLPGRCQQAMAYDAKRGQVVLFGGGRDYGNEALNDTWTFDGRGWTQRSPASSPQARYLALAAYDDARGVVVLFGGWGWDQSHLQMELADTWTWDGSSWSRH
jgi:hypothetical protein